MFCQNCGKEISPQAAACPGCGQPMAPVRNQFADGGSSAKSKTTAALLALLCLHRFYAGRIGSGIAQLLLCFTGIGIIWVIIDFVTILQGKFEDGDGLLIDE